YRRRAAQRRRCNTHRSPGSAFGRPRARRRRHRWDGPLPAAHQGGRLRRARSPPFLAWELNVTTSRRPILGIHMGDPAGVGPEIHAKALANPAITSSCRPIVIGDRSVMAATLEILHSPLELRAVGSPAECRFAPGTIECLDLGNVDAA